MRISNILRRIKKKLINKKYCPNKLWDKKSNLSSIKVIESTIGREEGTFVGSIKNGRLYTDIHSNVTAIFDNEIIGDLSWEFSPELDGAVEPSNNGLLTGSIKISVPPKKIDGVVVCLLSGGAALNNYFHWLFHVLPRITVAQEILGTRDNVTYLIPDINPDHPYQQFTLECFGVKASQCISSKDCQHLIADELIVTSHPNLDDAMVPEWMVHKLREKLMPTCSDRIFPNLVNISRADALNERRATNADECDKILAKAGIQPFHLTTLTIPEQINLFKNAKVVTGIHGAGFTNLIFCSPGARVYEIFSDVWVRTVYECMARILNLEYKRYTSPNSGQSKGALKASLVVKLEQVQEIADETIRLKNQE